MYGDILYKQYVFAVLPWESSGWWQLWLECHNAKYIMKGNTMFLNHNMHSSHSSVRPLKSQAMRMHITYIWIQHCAYDRLTECQGYRGHQWESWPAFAASCPASTRQTPSGNLKYMFYINNHSSIPLLLATSEGEKSSWRN